MSNISFKNFVDNFENCTKLDRSADLAASALWHKYWSDVTYNINRIRLVNIKFCQTADVGIGGKPAYRPSRAFG